MKPVRPTPSALDSIPRSLAFKRGIRGQCPRCEHSPLYVSTFRLHSRCPNCDLPLDMEDGWSYGSVPLAYALACVFWVLPIAMLFVVGLLGLKTAIFLSLGGVILLPIFTFRFTKSLWVGIYYSVLPQEMRHRPEDEKGDIH